MRRVQRRAVTLSNQPELTVAAVAYALEVLQVDDEGWAEIAVHQAEISTAMRVAREHNAKSPKVMLRVTTDVTIPRGEWRLRAAKTEVRSA